MAYRVHYNSRTGKYVEIDDRPTEDQMAIEADLQDADPPSMHYQPADVCAECGGELDSESVKCKKGCGASYCSACRYKMTNCVCIECADNIEAKGGCVHD